MSSRPRAIAARHLTVAFDGVAVFTDLSIDLGGIVAVVGENGAGKSCLLRAIAAAAPAPVIAFVEQGLAHHPMLDGLATPAGAAMAARFGVVVDDTRPWDTRSPGERRRALLAAAFAVEPDLLLLDEPTNHLDDDASATLMAALDARRGPTVIASHDRRLLEERARRTVVLHRGEHVVVDAGPGVALATFERRLQERRDLRRAALVDVFHARRHLAAARTTASQVEHQRHTRTRMKDRHDNDARGMLQKGRAEAAGKKAGREIEVRRRAVERAEARVDDVVGAPKRLGRSFFVDHRPAARPRVASWHGPLLVGDGVVLRERVDVDVGRADRVWLTGRNGTGKSTLLRALHGGQGDTLWLPQELDDVRAPLAAVRALPREVRGRTLQALAALGVDPERVLSSASPSMGEAKKLCLALAFATDVKALFLDEPGNHLDLPSVDRLAAAIAAFPGAVVVVTHDADLAASAGLVERYDLQTGRRSRV